MAITQTFSTHSSPTKHVKTRRPSCHAYVPLQLCSIYLHFSSEEFATLCVLFSLRLHLGIWALGFEREKGGYSCAVPGAPDPNRHASLYNPYRCPLSAVSRAGMPFLKPDVTLGGTPTDERELIRHWAQALLVFFVDSKRRYTIPVPFIR